MKVTHLKAVHFTRQPWRNGGGYTTQLAVHGEGEAFVWRLSMAEVARAGPFSDFSGYERTIVLIDGAGMDLAIAGRPPVRLRDSAQPFSFDGGARTDCTLVDGPVRDLNLIVRRHAARGTLEVVDANACEAQRLDARWTLVYAMRGWTRASMRGFDATLPPGELLRIDEPEDAELDLVGLDRGSRLAVVRVDPMD